MENTNYPCRNCTYSNVCGDSTRTETCNGKKDRISWERLSEIATKALHKLLELDHEEATEFFKDELDLIENECEYFELPTEIKPYEFTCSDCPYYYSDSYGEEYNGEPERCHYQGEDGYAPCSYEESYEESDYYE